jgi:hypothetical protein
MANANENAPEMTKFNSALRGVLGVTKKDLIRLLAEDKAARMPRKAGRQPRPSASAPVSSDKD